MTLSAPTGFTSTDLVYQEDFNGTALPSAYHNYLTSKAANGYPWNSNGSGGSGMGNQNNAEYDMPSQVTVSNGTLNLTAIKQPVAGVAQGSPYTFPVTSGSVSSYNNFEFNGGYLQISMKAPSGDGAWPALWLLPSSGAATSSDNFEIDMQEGGMLGSGPANQNYSWHLHTPSGTVGGVINSGVDLTAGYHTYGIYWDPGKSITWYLDGKQMAQVTSAQVPIPNEPMELIMSNTVANAGTSGWHTPLDSSTPSTMLMSIDQVQLYQKAGSGDTLKGGNITSMTTPTTPTTPTVQPAVTQVTASPGSGTEHVGDVITMTVGFNEAVTVTGTPTLSLNDGGKATYVGGSGTSALTFKTTVASTDTNTSALAVTGVNLNGGSIKDASGLAANLSAAVKTFSGLQISTSSPTTPTTPTTPTPSSIAPVLTIADNTLWVAGRGGQVSLGTKVTTTDPNDAVTVHITGLPKYETITDKLDGQTFRGQDITLTAAQVNSGLTLQSNYRGGGHPVATLTLTASAKDPSTGSVSTASSQTITVTDPRPTTTSTTTSTGSQTNQAAAQQQTEAPVTSSVATTPQQPTTAVDHPTVSGPGSTANHGVAALPQLQDLVSGGLANSASQPITLPDTSGAIGTSMASQASQSFALLNQYMAANTGRVDPGLIVAAVSNTASSGSQSFLTRPQA